MKNITASRLILIVSTVIGIAIFGEALTAVAQTTVQLPQVVIEEKRMELVSPTVGPAAAELSQARSSNTGVARVNVYRVNQVQVVAVGPGRSNVSFYDAIANVTYQLPVWVQAANSTGGGGQGFNPRLTQLPQIVMLVNHTQNVSSPGNAPFNINSVRSSNPSVATARTNTAGTIQIYSRALGDTFIEFTDNGVTYQVHVWVRDTVSGPDGAGGGGGGKGAKGPKPNPNPNPNPMPGPRSGQLDKCLVGRWVSESAAFNQPTSGGAGAIVVIQANGNLTADYNGMSKIVFSDGGAYHWTGTAAGHVSAENGLLVADRVDRSNFNYDLLDAHGKSMLTGGWAGWSRTLGAIFPPSTGGRSISYTCSESNLTILQTFNNSRTTFVFKRRKQ